MSQQKLSLFIGSLRGGGAEKVCVTLANYLVTHGFNVSLIVLNLHNAVYHKSLNKQVELLDLNLHHTRQSIFKIFQILISKKIQNILVFNHEIALVMVFFRFFIFKKVRIISRNINTLSEKIKHEKSIWHGSLKNYLLKLLYSRVDHVIVQSEGMMKDLTEHYGFRDSQLTIINNPLDPLFEEELYKPSGQAGDNKNEILFVGRFKKQKGISFLFDAFKIVLLQMPYMKLRLVGTGELYNNYLNYAKETGIFRNVIFEGYREDILPYYKQADVTVLSSLYEGFPNVLLESIACGTPVVSFDCPSGPKEIIEEGINGFLVSYRDAGHLADSIIRALKQKWDPDSIKKTAYKYSTAAVLDKYIKLLKEVQVL